MPSWNSSFSTWSLTVGGSITIEEFKFSEPELSSATGQKKENVTLLYQLLIALSTNAKPAGIAKYTSIYTKTDSNLKQNFP